MRRTKEQAAETADRILDAAKELFLNNGYEAVSLEEIAASAGLTRGAVYWHFQNKHGLLLPLIKRELAPLFEMGSLLEEQRGQVLLEILEQVHADFFARLEADPRQKSLAKVFVRFELSIERLAHEEGFWQETEATLTGVFEIIDRDIGLKSPWTPVTASSALCATAFGIVAKWTMSEGHFRLLPEGLDLLKIVIRSF